jgi:hypothetical protein
MAVKTDWAAGDILTASQVLTYLANSGLVYVTSVNIGATPIDYKSVTLAFDSDFDDYLIRVSRIEVESGAPEVLFFFENENGESVTTNYAMVGHYQTWGSSTLTGVSESYWKFHVDDATPNSFQFDVRNPYNASYKWMQAHWSDGDRAYVTSGRFAATTQFTRFRIDGNGYTLVNGHIDVFGYRHP